MPLELDWLSILEKVVELVLVPLVSGAIVHIISWIKAKKQELLEKVKDETTKKYLELLDKIIYECVLATNQTYVSALKDTGNFDENAHKHAFQLTYDTVISMLTDEAQKHLGEVIKDLPAFITTKIEAQVGLNHQ